MNPGCLYMVSLQLCGASDRMVTGLSRQLLWGLRSDQIIMMATCLSRQVKMLYSTHMYMFDKILEPWWVGVPACAHSSPLSDCCTLIEQCSALLSSVCVLQCLAAKAGRPLAMPS